MAEASASVTSDTAAENGPGWSDRPRMKLSVEAIAITGCVVGLLSLIVTIVALLPSFKGEELAIAQLKLAVWTASNEYLQQPKDQSVWNFPLFLGFSWLMLRTAERFCLIRLRGGDETSCKTTA
jgi:hypothetical protein